MGDLFSGGAVGAVMGELLRAAIEEFKKGRDFKDTLETNRQTLNSLEPIVEEMMRYNQQLDRPKHEIGMLLNQIREGKDLVEKSSKLGRWRFLSFPKYQGKLSKKDGILERMLSKDLTVQSARDSKEILVGVREILERLGKEDFGQYRGVVKVLRGVPEATECMGMDEPLRRLRVELLRDDVPEVLVLTGLGGYGKTTLAKKICWDPQVQDRFGTYIFFVVVSQTTNLKSIVQTLLENCGYQVPLQSDEDAINKLGILLRTVHAGKNPILLVLDDVWHGSEATIKNFKFLIPGYKILVTSRVAFPQFRTALKLEPLAHDEAVSLFLHFAKRDNSSRPDKREKKLVDEIVKRCMGSPLELEVIGGSLCQQPYEVWQNMNERLQSGPSFLESSSSPRLLSRLQQSLDILEFDKKECFVDLGLFPEDQRIPVSTLIDMWKELYNLDEDGRKAMGIIHDLTNRNLIKVVVTRKIAKDSDMYYNNHFVTLHDHLRNLAIRQDSREKFEQRRKLSIELNGNERPEWWVGQNQQGIFGRILSLLPIRSTERKQLRVAAKILSISTDENFSSGWCEMQPDEVEVLVLNIRSSKYSLPQFIEKMTKLKVLIVTNYGFDRSELDKFELLGSLPNLTRIRLEKVSVPRLCILTNLQKLSLHMCNTKQAFENHTIRISKAMPNLVEMSIDYCKDLAELPDEICEITSLKKLSVTNCHKLSVLPQGIEKLENLELLRLSSCSDLQEMPESVKGLRKLSCLDISDCVILPKLPEDIGELRWLERLYMKGCSGLSELPYSVMEFGKLEPCRLHVICDEERAAWWEENVPNFPKSNIETAKADISLNWLHGVRS